MIRVERRGVYYPFLRVYIHLPLFIFEPDLQFLLFLGLAHPWLRGFLSNISADGAFKYRIQLIESEGYTQEEALRYDPIPF